MKNGKSIRITAKIANIIWDRMTETSEDQFIQLNDARTKQTLVIVNIKEISHIS